MTHRSVAYSNRIETNRIIIQLNIGRWQVKNVKPTANGEAQEVKIKVRINPNGVILVTSANLVDKKAVKAAEEQIAADNSSGSTENGNNMDTQEVSSFSQSFILCDGPTRLFCVRLTVCHYMAFV